MQDLRIVLVIVGALAIAALVIHGLWTNQRNKRAQLKNSPPKPVPSKRGPESRDVDGFDADGIGQVRVVTPRNSALGRDAEPVISSVPQFSAGDEDEAKVPPVQPVQEETRIEPQVEPRKGIWKDVYVINIAARDGSYIYGRDLKHALRILGFRFGEMDIYHRHLEMDGQGEVLFSLINMIKPGTFDPSKMDRLMTPGVSLFMQLPATGRGLAHFDLMLKAADKLASEVDGLLFDAARQPLSEYYLTQCRDELKAYDHQ
ncbi:cell division protein ZipA [uncultured Tolumonas sp.]|jgi:cell division protein ZipA|uniref:cell division protein ZipA n=1 Tax=uncultured Tolumonas sp. TaxID=263765 RepID=UPI00292D5A5C|nr:cell division protein ZipA [uncultured Tolumonas sp.]